MDDQTPMISVSDVSHQYSGEGREPTLALSNVNLEVKRNEFVTLLGPSGCGKTTMMRAIGGLLAPSEGQIIVNGKPVDGPNQDCAIVFQSFALMPWATVLGNVMFGLEMRGAERATRESRARAAIAQVGLQGFESKLPKDQQTRRLMQEELLGIWQQDQRTVVFVTHDMGESILLADRIVLMSARPGRIDEVIDVNFPRPRNPDVVEKLPEFVDLKERLWQRLRSAHELVAPE